MPAGICSSLHVDMLTAIVYDSRLCLLLFVQMQYALAYVIDIDDCICDHCCNAQTCLSPTSPPPQLNQAHLLATTRKGASVKILLQLSDLLFAYMIPTAAGPGSNTCNN